MTVSIADLFKGFEVPKDWPLKRAITGKEFRQILKAMIVRRVPTHFGIPDTELARFVLDDLKAGQPKLWCESGDPLHYQHPELLERFIRSMVTDERLHQAMMAEDPENAGRAIIGVYRTERSHELVEYLPAALKAVLNYMPVTNIQAWMAYEFADGEAGDTDASASA